MFLIKTNVAFWIILKNWIDWYEFHEVSWNFIFIKRILSGLLKILWKNESHESTTFIIQLVIAPGSNIVSYSWDYIFSFKIQPPRLSFFHRNLSEPGRMFLMKMKFYKTSWNSYQSIQFFKIIQNVTLVLIRNNLSSEKLCWSSEKV